jgi:hypothetical protein
MYYCNCASLRDMCLIKFDYNKCGTWYCGGGRLYDCNHYEVYLNVRVTYIPRYMIMYIFNVNSRKILQIFHNSINTPIAIADLPGMA